MTGPFGKWGLPLLAKELTEQAARKRTYVVRVVYASLLFFSAYILFHNTLRFASASPLAILGQGRQMFEILVGLQFTGIYLFAPALTCGTITQEKERASLQLLFLTRLGPWTILFEKLLSRLIPIVCFLMLSLPLLAFSYSLGGISPEYLAGGVGMLVFSALQVATLGLVCSAYYRTTAAAFVATYLTGAAMFFGPPLFWEIVHLGRGYVPVEIRFPFFGAALFFRGNVSRAGWSAQTLLMHIAHAAPLLISSGAFLLLARFFIVRRAFAPPRNILLNIFGRLDRLFQRWNENRWTKGIVLIPDTGSLPEDQPIAWRETTKRSLGRARYLIRLFLVLEVPLLMLCLGMVAVALDRSGEEFVSVVIFFLWGISVLMVSVQAANLIAGEKSHQTLDVLCTTPLSSREIIRQKFRGVRRLIAVLLIPFLTMHLFQSWVKSIFPGSYRGYGYGHQYNPVFYLFSSMLTVGIYLPMVSWLSLWIGLKAKSQGRAIIGSLAAIVGWCLLPFLCCVAPVAYFFQFTEDAAVILLSSPLAQIVINEIGGPKVLNSPVSLLLNCLIYGFALLIFRGLCLNSAASLLGRSEVADETP